MRPLWMAGLALALGLVSTAGATTFVYRTRIPGGQAGPAGYWLIQAQDSATQTGTTPGSLSSLFATMTSLGYSTSCPAGAASLTGGSASAGTASPDTATVNGTFGVTTSGTYGQTVTFCIPANPSDVQSLSVTGNLNNAAFATPIPYVYSGTAPEVDYGSQTITAGGQTYTVYTGAGYLVDDGSPCGAYPQLGTAAVFAGVQAGSSAPNLNMPYVLGANSLSSFCDVDTLGILPN
ncbi:hypothetical protein [Thiomonas sp.]